MAERQNKVSYILEPVSNFFKSVEDIARLILSMALCFKKDFRREKNRYYSVEEIEKLDGRRISSIRVSYPYYYSNYGKFRVVFKSDHPDRYTIKYDYS